MKGLYSGKHAQQISRKA